MPSETGDMKILGNFRRLIDLVAADAAYQPNNGILKTGNLETRLAAASGAVDDIGVKIAPNKRAIDERQEAFKEAVALVRDSRNILKSSGASEATLEDADTFSRKVLGLRKSEAKVVDPNAPTATAEKSHSASQLSYDAILGNFRSYTEIVKNEPLYNPNEAEFKTSSLDATGDDLEAKNNAVSTTFVPLNSARELRDTLLYTGENNLCDVAGLVKAYVRGVHGATSQFYKTVNALSFKRNPR